MTPTTTSELAARRNERVQPQNLEAEQALLGAMLLSAEVAEGALGKVKSQDFYRPSHGKIFSAMIDLQERSIPIDHLSVADRLESLDSLEAVGGKPYLLELSSTVPTTANWESYAEMVARTSMLRQLIAAATHIVAMGYDAPDDLDEVVERAEQALFEVTNKRVASNFQTISDLLVVSLGQLEEMFERKEEVTGVPTGYKSLDKLLAGLHPGDLVILAARPSVGKTALALNMAVNAARKGTSVAVFSLEMSAEQLVQRVLCSEARINLQDVRSGHLRDEDWSAVHAALGKLHGLDFWVDDTPSISILEVRAKARRQLKDKPKGLIIVDYLQLMQPQHRRSENRQVEIAEISRGLKILAKELGLPVIALSQLSRAVEQRSGKRPMLSDLRESGAIEQDADVVMFIDRDTQPTGEEEEGRPRKGMAQVIVAKHRNGPLGTIDLIFQERFTKFIEPALNP